ncbi:hypothetical protein C8F01DRAFT_989693, partial [Mycena amicta]
AALIGELFGGALFGAIYCIAWNSPFPSAVEMWMWRVSAAVVAAVPLLVVLSVSTGLSEPGWFPWALLLLGVVYVLARLMLMVLPFTTLRTLPPGIFVDVNWSAYLPHL